MKLSIIIISYNTKKLLENCLGSIYKDLPKDFEVIVVDNASEDGSVNLVENRFKDVHLILNKKNLGFAKANNQGIKKAKGEYVLLLNSDTETTVKNLQNLISFAESKPKAGIISPQLNNPDKTIQQNGGGLPWLLNVFAWQFFLDEIPILTHLFTPYQREDLELYTKNNKTGWVSGAAMLIRKTCLDDLDGLDEKIFMYAEDVDICIRAQKAGWQTWVTAEAKVMHIGHASGNATKAIIGEYKGVQYLFNKHNPKQAVVISLILYYGAHFRSLIYKLIGNNDKANLYQQAAQVVRHTST